MRKRVTFQRQDGRMQGMAVDISGFGALNLQMIYTGGVRNPEIPRGSITPDLADGLETEDLLNFFNPWGGYQYALNFAAK